MGQLDLGEVWQDASGLVQCSCAAHGPVWVCDRRVGAGLIERTSRCEACGASVVVTLTPPRAPKAREAPVLASLELAARGVQ